MRCGNCCACRQGLCGHTGPCTNCYTQGSLQGNYQQQSTLYYNPQSFVTREHFDKTIEELKRLIKESK